MPNSDKVMRERLERFKKENGRGAKILLHTCCAPCLTGCIERIDENTLGLYFYNPNIKTKNEFDLRENELKRYIELSGKDAEVLTTDYDHDEFLEIARGFENEREGGARCERCYALRLREAAKEGVRLGYDFFATTLTLSPLKKAEVINRIGTEIGEREGIEYLPTDFKKREGVKRSVEISKEYDLYRQNFCGCEFSQREKL